MTTGRHARVPLMRKFRGPVHSRIQCGDTSFVFHARLQPLAPVGILHLTSIYNSPGFHALSLYQATVHSKHRILDILETLNTALHLLRRRIVSTFRVLVNIQLVVLIITALVLSLHNILPQNLGDGLYVLDRIVDLF
jgi:hypothetical protein